MQSLRALFSVQSTSNKNDLLHQEPTRVDPAKTSEIQSALKNNFNDLSNSFNDILEWSEYLRHKLENKKLNRADLAQRLCEFSEMVNFCHSLLGERTRVEQRLITHYCGSPATVKAQNLDRKYGK
jgi:hypothetical protein